MRSADSRDRMDVFYAALCLLLSLSVSLCLCMPDSRYISFSLSFVIIPADPHWAFALLLRPHPASAAPPCSPWLQIRGCPFPLLGAGFGGRGETLEMERLGGLTEQSPPTPPPTQATG